MPTEYDVAICLRAIEIRTQAADQAVQDRLRLLRGVRYGLLLSALLVLAAWGVVEFVLWVGRKAVGL